MMSDPLLQIPQELSYATPDRSGPSPLTAAVWISIVGLGLIFFGGCFLIGIVIDETLPAPNGVLIGLLYLCAFICFACSAWVLRLGLGRLWSIARGPWR